MRAHKTTLFVISLVIVLFAACKKETTFTYKANCTECKISFYDEKGTYVIREQHQGSFEKEISVAQFSPVLIAVQSTVTDSTALVTDQIITELRRDGEVVCADTSSTGLKFQAVSCSFDWQK